RADAKASALAASTGRSCRSRIEAASGIEPSPGTILTLVGGAKGMVRIATSVCRPDKRRRLQKGRGSRHWPKVVRFCHLEADSDRPATHPKKSPRGMRAKGWA